MIGKCIYDKKEYLFIYPEGFDKLNEYLVILIDYEVGCEIKNGTDEEGVLSFNTYDYIGKKGFFVYSYEIEIINSRRCRKRRIQ